MLMNMVHLLQFAIQTEGYRTDAGASDQKWWIWVDECKGCRTANCSSRPPAGNASTHTVDDRRPSLHWNWYWSEVHKVDTGWCPRFAQKILCRLMFLVFWFLFKYQWQFSHTHQSFQMSLGSSTHCAVVQQVERLTCFQQVVGSNSTRGRSCVTTLGKFFTPMCLCHQAV